MARYVKKSQLVTTCSAAVRIKDDRYEGGSRRQRCGRVSILEYITETGRVVGFCTAHEWLFFEDAPSMVSYQVY